MPRPRLDPTEQQRKMVKSLAAIGIRQSDIARMINIRSPKTLRKYFREELDRGDLEGYIKVQQTRFQMATGGKHWHATEAWLHAYARRQGHRSEDEAPPPPPSFIIVPKANEV